MLSAANNKRILIKDRVKVFVTSFLGAEILNPGFFFVRETVGRAAGPDGSRQKAEVYVLRA